MDIKRAGSQPSTKGPSDWFTGDVRIDPLFQANNPARVQGASVTFEPGARTAWHTHPLGQTLIVTAGRGWAQHDGGSIEEILPGDVIWFSPGEKHWHGATPTTAVTHIAIQEARARHGRTIPALNRLLLNHASVLSEIFLKGLTPRLPFEIIWLSSTIGPDCRIPGQSSLTAESGPSNDQLRASRRKGELWKSKTSVLSCTGCSPPFF